MVIFIRRKHRDTGTICRTSRCRSAGRNGPTSLNLSPRPANEPDPAVPLPSWKRESDAPHSGWSLSKVTYLHRIISVWDRATEASSATPKEFFLKA